MIRIPLNRPMVLAALLLGALTTLPQWAAAQPAPIAAAPVQIAPAPVPQTVTDGSMQISWGVRNRFRLFREERDFLLHADSMRAGSVLAAEQTLEPQGDGRGWARNMVNRLCIDLAGRVSEPCSRDNVKESYLTPTEHPVTVKLSGAVPVGATCAWTLDDGDGPPRQQTFDCNEPVNFRARYGKPTQASVDVSSGPDAPQRVTTEIMVRDIFIAGLGDSIASGEGNPDRAIALSDEGFCFRSYLGNASAQYYRPSRAGYKGGRACEAPDSLAVWQRQSALWFNSACHRSLYSYQTRTALALAVQYPHIAVTYLPLACTGATIADGLFGTQRARECLPAKNAATCAGTVSAQLAELREAVTAAKRRQPARTLDLVLLSVGANDIDFSGLVADVIVDTPTERALFRQSGVMGSVADSRAALARELPQGFGKLREALKPLVGDLQRVVFVSYANPTLDKGAPCPGGRAGFDIHPSFNADPQRLANVSRYVRSEFLPQLRAIVLCESGVLCRDPARDRMTFVDAHQAAFAEHGFCARAQSDPEFDRECFSATGDSFDPDIVSAASQPMRCGRSAGDYRAYLPRARWIRDANDSYFAAMTYPQALPSSSQPADIHDATWGVLSAVYGGAVHPTAEGHAAMADAAVPAAAAVLRLDAAEPEVSYGPLEPAGAVPQ
jgi:lysophospholipase L1-like esterase